MGALIGVIDAREAQIYSKVAATPRVKQVNMACAATGVTTADDNNSDDGAEVQVCAQQSYKMQTIRCLGIF